MNARKVRYVIVNARTTLLLDEKGDVTERWERNLWLRAGHCRRCENGLGHTDRRRGAGGERPSGVSLQRAGGKRNVYEDETAPGEQVYMRRQARRASKRAATREISEEML